MTNSRNIAQLILGVLLGSLLCACGGESSTKVSPALSLKSKTEEQTTIHPPQIIFTDVTASAGIDFVYKNGAEGDKWLPETYVGGLAFLDYDNDGDADLFAVSGTDWKSYESKSGPVTIALFRNDGGTKFTDVTQQLELDFNGYGLSFAIGDYDGDGWQDVFVAALGENHLLRNIEGKKFENVTQAYNVAGRADALSIVAGFFDADNDSDLDLLVGNYLIWSRELDKKSTEKLVGLEKAYSGPGFFPSDQLFFYRNQNGETFSEEGKATGFHVYHASSGLGVGKALGFVPIDINNDGALDVVVANDLMRNFAFINDAKGNFEEQAEKLGLAYNNLGMSTAAMGIDAAWLQSAPNEDMQLHIGVGNFSGEMSSVYRKETNLDLFTDVAALTGIGPNTRKSLTFGVLFADIDLDGRADFIQANGNIEPEIERVQRSQTYRQVPQLFWHCGAQCPRPFVMVEPGMTGALQVPLVARGLAEADFDLDGDVDLAFSEVGGKLRLYRNDQATGHHWLRVVLSDNHSKNKYAIGATVEVVTQDEHQNIFRQQQHVMPTGSYVSQNETALTFGLGKHNQVFQINVRWPDGQQTTLKNIQVDQVLTISKPKS